MQKISRTLAGLKVKVDTYGRTDGHDRLHYPPANVVGKQ